MTTSYHKVTLKSKSEVTVFWRWSLNNVINVYTVDNFDVINFMWIPYQWPRLHTYVCVWKYIQ